MVTQKIGGSSPQIVESIEHHPSNSAGTTVACGNSIGTYGSWVEVIADTGSEDLYLITYVDQLAGSSARIIADIGLGGSGSESAIGKIHYGIFSQHTEGESKHIPFLKIPAGSRVSIRIQDDNLTHNHDIMLNLAPLSGGGAGTLVIGGAKPTYIESIEIIPTDVSTTLDAQSGLGADLYGSYVEVTSDVGADDLYLFMITNGGSVRVDEGTVLQFATGAVSSEVNFATISYAFDDDVNQQAQFIPLLKFPAGERISVRAKDSNSNGNSHVLLLCLGKLG